ncbi:DUF1206 domain-containing protein [Actinomadura nitritigenes]|uniref:DUF1206 domain-containing protein n=1 Tax=Actinomadura nitritigenes TaxID=134602 RepID=A0ABS3QT91_9ACTN|nr:DUF1206 domain-containing protein [Actinomadura nitritigenes]MBO2437131.1 DUF1206 domain-containing protein [Actinomadura nitritigenes]
MAAKDTARDVGRRAAGHPWFHRLSRAGLAARGVLYLLIGWLALLIASGHGGKEADKQGALRAIADRPGGWAVLCLLAAGFAGLALWQFAEALYGRPLPQGRRKRMRFPAAFRGLTYTVGCVGTIGFLFGLGHTSSDQQSRAMSARAMAEPGGRWAVLAVGAGFVVWGAVTLVNAGRRAFRDELATDEMGPVAHWIVQPLGMVGNIARGLIGGAVGAFLAYAAISFEPDRAQGLDGVLREFAATPAGGWGLAVIALGVVTFGLYSFCEVRWRKVEAVEPQDDGPPGA